MNTSLHTLWLITMSVACAGCSQYATEPTHYSGGEVSSSTEETTIQEGIITNGMTEASLIDAIGEPKGIISNQAGKMFLYEGFRIRTKDGTVYDLPERFNEFYADMHTSPIDRLKEYKLPFVNYDELKAARARKRAFVWQDANGAAVMHNNLVHTGQVTVVAFYTDMSKACQAVEPCLTELLSQYENVALKRVNIYSWNSELAKQYHIATVPDIRILDPYGNLVAQPVTRIEMEDGAINLDRVNQAINKAKKL